MDKLFTMLKDVPRKLWVVIVGVLLIIIALPALLTRPGLLDFSQTGQIGDTIGGTMGPFVAIIAAFLTFIAFWVQFMANQELIKENRRNHFENRFYKMLDIHIENVDKINQLKKKGDSTFSEWCSELKNLNEGLVWEIERSDFYKKIRQSNSRDSYENEFWDLLDKMESSTIERNRILFDVTYVYFFNKDYSFLPVETQTFVKILSANSNFIMNNIIVGKAKNEILGRYYRHLYQIVSFVDSQPDNLYDDFKWKSDYVGMLRSQMSDYEQLLLYYNAQSPLGKAWDENHFIEKYKLIKNIPRKAISSCAGITPSQRYLDEIKRVESKGEKFFERA